MVDLLAWPVRVEGGRVATVTAGSDAEAVQDVEVLLATRAGERVAAPLFGTADPVGLRDYDEAAVIAAAARWCPHSEIVAIDFAYDPADPLAGDAAVTVRRR